MRSIQNTATILVIDDDPLMMTAVAAALHLSGHECHCARDSEAALKAAHNLELDLIICDVNLGEEDGLELCREILQIPWQQDVPLLFTSASHSADIIRQVREAGGVYYLRKPYDPEVLLELVEKALWMPHLVGTRMRHALPKMTAVP